MRKFPPTRFGQPIRLSGQQVYFSFWPVVQLPNALFVDSMLWTNDPWTTIESTFVGQNDVGGDVGELQRLFLLQSREFFAAAGSASPRGAQATLYYYSFLNLAKAFVLQMESNAPFGPLTHGLSARTSTIGDPLQDGWITFRDGDSSAFAEFARALGPADFASAHSVRAGALAAQSLVGHRLWSQAKGVPEKYVRLRYANFWDAPKEMLLTVCVSNGDAMRRHATLEEFSRSVGLPSGMLWQPAYEKDHEFIQIGQFLPKSKMGSTNAETAQAIMEIIRGIRPILSRFVTTIPPDFRRYYFFALDSGEVRYPQLLCYYAFMFYLGSMARYHPRQLRKLLDSELAPFVVEFLSTVPLQFLYLIASEFKKQEVSRAAVVSA